MVAVSEIFYTKAAYLNCLLISAKSNIRLILPFSFIYSNNIRGRVYTAKLLIVYFSAAYIHAKIE